MPDPAAPAGRLTGEALADPSVNLAYTDILVLSPTPTAPIDQGNRKRIHAVCSELKRRGARIHFVYYPHEWWFSFAPMDLAREMSAQWDSFHLLPATRPLHTRAEQEDHTIDEWWDKAIGKYLKWLFARGHYDAFIVNYAYLSKAFKYAPKDTLKILDTHDKMSGRRQLLEANGVAREFFYTTADQEAIALDRAQLVWAIKDEEAEFFRTISQTPCITMPHVEPRRQIPRRRAPEDEGYLVIGMLGAHNSINTRNARNFVARALPCFQRELAPVKIRFAGSMCTALGDLAQAGVEIIGPVNAVEEFYAAVDVAVVPLAFSTGLKIKAVEAFASGMPLVAMSHALEGIPAEHPFHHCQSVETMAEACIELAGDPDLLQQLRASTLETYTRIEQQAVSAFDFTAARISCKPAIVMLVDQLFFEPDSPYREHAIQTLRELSHEGRVVMFFDQPLPAVQGPLFAQLDRLIHLGKICLAPEIAGDRPRSLGMMSSVASLDALLLASSSNTLWALRTPAALSAISDAAAARTSLYLRTDVLRIYQPLALADLANDYRRFRSVKLVDSSAPGSAADLLAGITSGFELHNLPYWKHLPHKILSEAQHSARIDILATGAQTALATIFADSLNDVSVHGPRCRLVLVDSAAQPAAGITHQTVMLDTVMKSFAEIARLPAFVLDLCGEVGNAALYLDTMRHADVPIFHRGAAFLQDGRLAPRTLLDWIETLLEFEAGVDAGSLQRSKNTRYHHDPGWREIRKAIANEAA